MNKNTINRIRKFVTDREWNPSHTPANLAKSISIEASELLDVSSGARQSMTLIM